MPKFDLHQVDLWWVVYFGWHPQEF